MSPKPEYDRWFEAQLEDPEVRRAFDEETEVLKSSDRRANIEKRYVEMFGEPYAKGRAEVAQMVRRFVTMGSFAKGIGETSKTSLSDRAFAKIAFFALVGAAEVDFDAPSALPESTG